MPSQPVGAGGVRGPTPLLATIYAEARKRDMQSVPVVRAGESSADHIALAVDTALEESAHGIEIRYHVASVCAPPPGTSRADFLNDQLAAVGCGVEQADLILDLRIPCRRNLILRWSPTTS